MTEQLVSLKTKSILHDKGFFNGGFNIDIRPTSNLPTQSLVQKWLREVHNIHISVICSVLRDKYWSEIYGQNTTAMESVLEYSTYEEALENALQESLKLIK